MATTTEPTAPTFQPIPADTSVTHFALIHRHPELTLIAGGSEEHCRTQLQLWIDKHPLDHYSEGEVVQRLAVLPNTHTDGTGRLPSGKTPQHHCESWQLQDSAKGGRYCGACGRHYPEMPQTGV